MFSLTAVIWITQALREFDLLTAKRQTILMFLAVTSLSIPALITIIAPVALFIATIYALNKLNGDSELIVMSAAGLAPARLLRPFLALTIAASLLVAAMTLWAMPASFRDLRDLITQIRADFLTKIVREGQFTSLDMGITFHYRERSGEALLGIFMQDRRDKEKTSTYIAERGQTIEANGLPYLVLEKGSVQREQAGVVESVHRGFRALCHRPQPVRVRRRRDHLQAARAQHRRTPQSGPCRSLREIAGGALQGGTARPASPARFIRLP